MNRDDMGKAVMELVGTGILLFTIQMSVGNGTNLAALSIGIVLVTIVYAGGPISGAHYNPAVSLSLRLIKKMEAKDMITYWVAQIAGGFLGALLGGIVGGTFSIISVGSESNLMQAFLAEVIFTMVLCLVVLSVATHSDAKDNSYYGLAIGGVVLAGAISVGNVSGGAFNPAVALGLSLSKGFANLPYVLTICLANLLGGVCAASIYFLAAPNQFDGSTGTVGETTSLL